MIEVAATATWCMHSKPADPTLSLILGSAIHEEQHILLEIFSEVFGDG